MARFSKNNLRENYQRMMNPQKLHEAYGLHPDVIRQYLETAVWASTDDTNTPYDAQYDSTDFSKEAVDKSTRDIEKMIKMADDAGVLDPYLDAFVGSSWGQFGHDFLLTRNGHGAGFWDRTEVDAEVGDKLTELAETFNEVHIFVGEDGKLEIE